MKVTECLGTTPAAENGPCVTAERRKGGMISEWRWQKNLERNRVPYHFVTCAVRSKPILRDDIPACN
jgi:hypothetical protein